MTIDNLLTVDSECFTNTKSSGMLEVCFSCILYLHFNMSQREFLERFWKCCEQETSVKKTKQTCECT